MKVLFVHPNFPAQFRHIAGALGRESRHEVVFATANPRPEWNILGVKKAVWKTPDPLKGLESADNPVASLISPFDRFSRIGKAAFELFLQLEKDGFSPDVIMGHSGWGSTMFVKEAFPRAKFLAYFEWYYNGPGVMLQPKASGRLVNRVNNSQMLFDMEVADLGNTPTRWQLRQFPPHLLPPTTILHDGIDTGYFAPATQQKGGIPDFSTILTPLKEDDLDLEALSKASELVTYTSRGLEPFRGYPEFIRSLPEILDKRPGAHVLIVGSDRICYGDARADGKSWKEAMREEVQLDPARVQFLDGLPYGKYKRVLQASTVHTFLTRPFVLSWSMLEAMATGVLLVGSDTPPVREVVRDGQNGLLTPLAPRDIALKVVHALENAPDMAAIRQQARTTVQERFDLARLLPLHLRSLECLAQGWKPERDPLLAHVMADSGRGAV